MNRRAHPRVAFAAGLAAFAAVPGMGLAQGPPLQNPPPSNSPQTQAPLPAPPPGLIGTIGNWIGRSADDVAAKFNSARQSAPVPAPSAPVPEAKDPPRPAGEPGPSLLPSAGVVTGRALCVTAANGAPDCKAAADELCRGKGMRSGRSLGSETSENCPVQVLVTGKRSPGDCRMETFVTRAVCQ
ncbi:MAG: hypothetical protein EPO23_10860 [Xanthobacteraceae bacterium]|nr:MAG: hypothetical protein EPO23_10860 [Xanthobacteraceae bacterium]